MTEREVEIQIESWRRSVVAYAPRGHRRRTDFCPPIPKLASGILTNEERAHLAACDHCRKATRTPAAAPVAIAAPMAAVAVVLALTLAWSIAEPRDANPVQRFLMESSVSFDRPAQAPLTAFAGPAPELAVVRSGRSPIEVHSWTMSEGIPPAVRAVNGPAPPLLPAQPGTRPDPVWSALSPQQSLLDAL